MCFRSAKQNLKMNSENLRRAGGEKPEWGFVRSSPKTRRSLYSGVLKFLLHGRNEGEKPQTCVCLFRAERESTGFICTWFLDQSRCFQHAIKGFNIEWYFRDAECILLFGSRNLLDSFPWMGIVPVTLTSDCSALLQSQLWQRFLSLASLAFVKVKRGAA